MWLHLGGSYWQRASFDAVTVLASGLALLVYAPRFTAFRQRHFFGGAALLLFIAIFFALWSRAWQYAERSLLPHLERLEEQAPK
jgi:hypothetical protein